MPTKKPGKRRVLRAPAPRKANRIHRPVKGKGSFRRRPRTPRGERDAS